MIGVVSDTHGYLNPKVPELLAGVEHILHAGDIGDAGIIEELARIAPVTTVRGNNDRTGQRTAPSLVDASHVTRPARQQHRLMAEIGEAGFGRKEHAGCVG